MHKKTISVLVGSLRQQSYSKKVAQYLATQLTPQFDVRFLDLGELPLYNQDLDDQNPPESWQNFRQAVRSSSAVLFVTPEYNRSIPPVLKNALDIASRPMAENAWGNKPGAVVSISPGKVGGFGANHHLRQVAACLNIAIMPQPEAYLGEISTAVNETTVTNERTQAFLQKFASAFAGWINRVVQ